MENAPLLTQELMLAWWKKHGRPGEIHLLPEGTVRIAQRGTDKVAVSGNQETLTRYTVHGVTWGDETVWLNSQDQIAALIGADAEEDRFEALRPPYVPAMKQLVKQAAADAVASLKSAGHKFLPLAGGLVALTHATVIDPRNAAPLPDTTVLIENGKIAAVGPAVAIPAGTKIFDARGKFILPGLWDTHAHFEQWEWGPAYLASGITSVRDVGNEIEFLTAIRASLNAGQGLGPMMYAAGLIDSDPGSLTSEHAEDAEAVRRIVRRYHDLGYEEMKIYQSLKPELIPVVADEAHKLGMQVTGHIPTGTDALRAVEAGMDQINHNGFAVRVMRAKGETQVRADSPESQKAVHTFLEHHTVFEPTLARSEFGGHPRRRPFGEIEPSVAWLPPELAIILVNAGVSENNEARAAAGFQMGLSATRILHDAGITILAGSDEVVPGHSLHRELELLVQAGLTPIEAIRCATTAPPSVLGIAGEVGAIEPGKRADLVVLDADPLRDIRNVRRVRWTISRGRVFEPAVLWKAVDIQPPVR
jgi:imidazolonepropionase-like amidohydrolase